MKYAERAKKGEARFSVSFKLSGGGGKEHGALSKGRRSERGVALVVVLVLSAVVLAVMTALLYMINSATQISGLHKQYKTAQQAADGCSTLLYQVISLRGNGGSTSYASEFTYVVPSLSPTLALCAGTDSNGHTSDPTGVPYIGFNAKLGTSTSTWLNCNTSLDIDPYDPTTYDVTMTLGQYTCYAKISTSAEGNSGPGTPLYTGNVESAAWKKNSGGGASGAIPVVSHPYLYAIEVTTVNPSNLVAERAKYSILYQY